MLAAVACVLAGALVLAPGAGALLVHLPNGHIVGVQLRKGVSRAVFRRVHRRSRTTQVDTGAMVYQGGPVLHTSDPYLVFWGPGGAIPSSSESLLERYLSDVAAAGFGADVYGVTRQYYDGNGFADARQRFSAAAQAIKDTEAYPTRDSGNCPAPAGYTACVTDIQIQNELTRLIAARHLPTGIGAGAPVYYVITPIDTDVCIDSGDCADTNSKGSFCGYHGDFLDGGQEVIYASDPAAALNPNPKGCQTDSTTPLQDPNANDADVLADDLSHENNESLTDPVGNSPAWIDPISGNEIEDNCQTYGSSADPAGGFSPQAYLPTLGGSAAAGTLYDQLINGDRYYTQTTWSNGGMGCLAAPPGASVAPAYAASSPVLIGTSVLFKPTGSTASEGISSSTWSFGDGASAFVVGAPVAISHHYTRTGTYKATLTLVDTRGDARTVLHQVSVVAAGEITKLAVKKVRTSYYLVVTVNEPGTITVGGKRITLHAAGSAAFRIPLSAQQQRAVKHHHTVSVKLTIVYVPRFGQQIRRSHTAVIHG